MRAVPKLLLLPLSAQYVCGYRIWPVQTPAALRPSPWPLLGPGPRAGLWTSGCRLCHARVPRRPAIQHPGNWDWDLGSINWQQGTPPCHAFCSRASRLPPCRWASLTCAPPLRRSKGRALLQLRIYGRRQQPDRLAAACLRPCAAGRAPARRRAARSSTRGASPRSPPRRRSPGSALPS